MSDESTAKGWELALIDSAWHGSEFDGEPGLALARELGYEAIDLFVGFDPGTMPAAERATRIRQVRESGLPVISVVCTCLGLNDFNPAMREYHIRRACSVIDCRENRR